MGGKWPKILLIINTDSTKIFKNKTGPATLVSTDSLVPKMYENSVYIKKLRTFCIRQIDESLKAILETDKMLTSNS